MDLEELLNKIATSSMKGNLGLFAGSGYPKSINSTIDIAPISSYTSENQQNVDNYFCHSLSWDELLCSVCRKNSIDIFWKDCDEKK